MRKEGKRGRADEGDEGEEWVERVDWSEGAREEFRKRTEEIELEKGGVNEVIERLIERIKAAVRVKKRKRKAKGRRGWWDGECRRKKEVERTLKKWGKEIGVGRITGEREGIGWIDKMCERKRRQENEE